MATTARADIYDGISVSKAEESGIEVLLARGAADPLTKVIQVLVLNRIAEAEGIFSLEKESIAYLVKEESPERVRHKAGQTLYGLARNPISARELDGAKDLLRMSFDMAEEVQPIEIADIFTWLGKMHASQLSKAKGFQFNVSKEDQENIGKLIYALSHFSYFQLLWKQKDVNALGDSLRHVPPLQFLLTCCGSEKLKGWLQNVRKSTLKWNAFMEGLSESLSKERAAGTLNDELPGFAMALKKKDSIPALQEYAASGRWNLFVEELLK